MALCSAGLAMSASCFKPPFHHQSRGTYQRIRILLYRKIRGAGNNTFRTRQHDESKQPDRDVSVCMYYPVPRYHSLSEQQFERTKGKPARR